MTAIQRPTDSVLRRHFEFGLQTEWPSAAPQDSMLIRHHEQMRAAWREGAEQTPFEALGNSPISLAVERHPLAIHLEARPIPLGPLASPSSPAPRPTQTMTAPPEDWILARHHAQKHDVSFAEHPLAAHLRHVARQASKKCGTPAEAPTKATSSELHPLAIHLEARPAMPGSLVIPPAPAARPTQTKTAPPEDSTLNRHYAQMHNVSFAEHPLSTHLRMIVGTSRASSEDPLSRVAQMERPPNPVEEISDDDSSTATPGARVKQATQVPTTTSEPTAQKAPPASIPDQPGWLRRLLRSITGDK